MTEPLTFRVLGPLDVRVGERRVVLGGERQQVVLAALLLATGRTVGVAELVDAVWAADPPPTARRQLHTAIWQLRRALQRHGHAEVLHSEPAGYRIDVDNSQLDLRRFELAVAEGRRLAAQGEPVKATRELREALALWRGPALAGLAGPVVEREADRLAEARLTAIEDCLEFELASGDHGDIVPELSELVTAHPLRERLAAALMLALYRGGRQADALAAYRRVAETLAEELGLDPGDGLRRRYEAILRRDPALDPPGRPPAGSAPASAGPAGAGPAGAGPAGTGPAAAGRAGDAPAGAAPAVPAPAGDGTAGTAATHPGTTESGHGPAESGPHPAESGPRPGEVGPSSSAGRAPVRTPAQLPAPVAAFVGRAEYLDQLDALLENAAGTVMITAMDGMGGIGKTALALHWAHRVADRFPDGQLYVNLRGFDTVAEPVEPAEALRGFLDALEVPAQRVPAGLPERIGLYRSEVARRRMLILLDNARDVEQVRPLLPGSGGSVAIVTSRRLLTGLITAEGAYPLTVDLLSPAEAEQLLVRRLGAARVAAEPEAVQTIIDRCSRLPLALAIVAARAATLSRSTLTRLADELATVEAGLNALANDDATADVRAVFSWSYRLLSDPSARLFRLLSLHPGPDFSVAAAADLAGVGLDAAAQYVSELHRIGLLTEPEFGRFAMHDLMRTYAAELVEEVTPQERGAATRRMIDHYVRHADAVDRVLRRRRAPFEPPELTPSEVPAPDLDPNAALAWFVAEHPVLLRVLHRAITSFLAPHVWHLAWTTSTQATRRGKWRDEQVVQQAAVAAARLMSDPLREATAHNNLGVALNYLSRTAEAETELRIAAALFREVGDEEGEIRTLFSLGAMVEAAGRFDDAVANMERAAAVCRTSERWRGLLGNALNNLAWTHVRRGDHAAAPDLCAEALKIHEETGDRFGAASAWHTLGYARHQLGEYGTALECYDNALAIIRQLGARFYEAETLDQIGVTRLASGDAEGARAAWREALVILEDLGHASAERVRARL